MITHTNLPYKQPAESEIQRRNGDWRFYLSAPSDIGLPFGRYPRLLMAYFSDYAVTRKTPEIDLGRSMSEFMARLDIAATGGKTGSFARFRDQLIRLASTTFKAIYLPDEGAFAKVPAMEIVGETQLWWDVKSPEHPLLLDSTLTLSDRFFQELLAHPIPMDLRALRALTSPIALDLYVWLAARFYTVDKPTLVPWSLLHDQFGSHGTLKEFRRLVRTQLKKVLTIYPDAKVSDVEGGLELRPSRPHVPEMRLIDDRRTDR